MSEGCPKRAVRIAAAAAVLVALAACSTRPGDDSPAPPPQPVNVILLSLDTLRADHLGVYGYERGTSPFLDRLAARGVVFERAYAPSSWTVPSHASLLSGLYPNTHGMRVSYSAAPADLLFLSTILDRAGYDTAGIINALYLRKFRRGFDTFIDVAAEPPERGAIPLLSALALAWLDGRPPGPFFLFLHTFDVHTPYGAEPSIEAEFLRPYGGGVRGLDFKLRSHRLKKERLTEADAQHLIDLYDAGIRQLDRNLERFFEKLDAGGFLENTLVVITADHGEEFLEHGDFLHGRTLHRELVQVPLIFVGGPVPHGRRVATPVSLIDVVPTVASVAGLPIPPGLDGIDISGSWQDRPRALPPRPIYFEGEEWLGKKPNEFRRAVLLDEYKLHLEGRGRTPKLYDVQADPDEQRDVLDRNPAVAGELEEALGEYMARSPKKVRTQKISPEDEEKLRALGYLE